MPWTSDGTWLEDEVIAKHKGEFLRGEDGSVTPLHRTTGLEPDYYFHDGLGNAWPRWRNPLRRVKGKNFGFNMQEVAVQLGVQPRDVRRLIHMGKLPAYRPCPPRGQMFVKAGDLQRFLRESRVGYAPRSSARTRKGA